MENNVIIKVNDAEVTQNDILILLKTQGKFRQALQDLIRIRAIQDFAKHQKIEVSDDELQNFVNDKRKKLGLISAKETQQYFSQMGITSDQWIDSIEFEFLESKVKKTIIGDDKIEQYFIQNKMLYLTVDLLKILVPKKGEAEELLMEARDDGKDFSGLSTKYSEDSGLKMSGGNIGNILRGMLAPEIEGKVFTADEGEIVGPIQEADKYSLYKVQKRHEPELNDKLKEEIKTTLYSMWQNQIVQSVRIESP